MNQARVNLFRDFAAILRAAAPQTRPAHGLPGEIGRGRHLPFFSNFIEGTEFTVDEAQEIAFEGRIIDDRPEDSHDIIGTYCLVADSTEMVRAGHDADEFILLNSTRHAFIMEGRPDKRPGRFKRRDNRAGETHFVSHLQTEGTLRAGFEIRDELDTAWERAIYVAFLIAEMYPFDDGDGRLARVMMNAELSASGECRIIVPTVLRQDYLDGLRRLSRQHDPSVFIKAMRFAHDFTSSIDFSDDETARRMLTQANAFNEPDSADRLRIPEQPRFWEDRTVAMPWC